MSFAIIESRAAAILMIALTVAGSLLAGKAVPKKVLPIREQLLNLQRETGLTMGTFRKGIGTSDFAHRSDWKNEELPPPAGMAQDGALSPHGTKIAFDWVYPYPHPPSLDSRLAVVRRDGSGLREYPDLRRPYTFCWSPDESKLVVYSLERKGAHPSAGGLYLLDLSSGKAEPITDGPAHVAPQCWAPDGERIVYGLESGIRKMEPVPEPTGVAVVYDLRERKSVSLGSGVYPTWSPDGKWIAVYEQDGYYLIQPTGEWKKLFFSAKNATTGLLWSPRSLFVAYGICCRYYMFEGTGVRIHVRRLADGADEWVTEISHVLDDRTFNWIQPPQGAPSVERAPDAVKPPQR